jgi:hypothetical protein
MIVRAGIGQWSERASASSSAPITARELTTRYGTELTTRICREVPVGDWPLNVFDEEQAAAELTGALQWPASPAAAGAVGAARVAAANHGVLIFAMVLGGVVGLQAAISVQDTLPRDQVASTLVLPLPMIAGLALSLAVAGHRVLALCLLPLILAAGTVHQGAVHIEQRHRHRSAHACALPASTVRCGTLGPRPALGF